MSLLKLTGHYWDFLTILLYVAKSDGAMRASEVSVIHTALKHLTGDDIDLSVVKEALGAVNLGNVRAFTATCRKLKTNDCAQFDICCEVANAIVKSKNSPHPNETAALAVMSKVQQESNIGKNT